MFKFGQSEHIAGHLIRNCVEEGNGLRGIDEEDHKSLRGEKPVPVSRGRRWAKARKLPATLMLDEGGPSSVKACWIIVW